MTIRSTYALALALAACGIDVPKEPSWTEDVRPILAANCIRCHGAVSTGGAPNTFRLDTYDDIFRLDGSAVRGAATMAEFIATRAGEMGEMPPDWPRTDDQRDILINWWARAEEQGAGVMPELGPFRASTAPTAVALDLPATADADPVTVRYEISDADGDLVTGALLVGDVEVSRDLVDGRSSISFDPSSFPEGSYDVIARVSDDIDREDVVLGSIDIAHASGNAAPRARIAASPDGVAPVRDLLFAPAIDPPTTLYVLAQDADGDAMTFDLIAFRGSVEMPIVEDEPVTGAVTTYDFDATGLDFATNWRLRLVVDDGTTTTTDESAPFIISDKSTMVTFAQVQGIFEARCGGCHPNKLPTVGQLFATQGGVKAAAGMIYRRVVQERTMPPPSATGVVDGFEEMTAAERDTIADYLLGGAP